MPIYYRTHAQVTALASVNTRELQKHGGRSDTSVVSSSVLSQLGGLRHNPKETDPVSEKQTST